MCGFLQINGSNIRDDREWRDSRGSGDAATAIFRLSKMAYTNWDFSNGGHDDFMHYPNLLYILSSMGWHVLWTFN